VSDIVVGQHMGLANTMLKEDHKAFIANTPFAWLMYLQGKVKLSRKLLTELCTRWIERRGGFLIRSNMVMFAPLDVCVILDLRIGGYVVDLSMSHMIPILGSYFYLNMFL